MAAWAACHPAVLNTSHAATAIRMYNVVHTGPKIQRGGVHVSFLSVGYQVFTDDAVKIDPMPPDAKQSTTKMMSISRSPFTVPVLRLSSGYSGECIPCCRISCRCSSATCTESGQRWVARPKGGRIYRESPKRLRRIRWDRARRGSICHLGERRPGALAPGNVSIPGFSLPNTYA